MSTTEVSKWQVVMKQFHYKRKAYVSIFLTLIFVQILGMLFSFTSNGGGSGDSIGISYGYTLYSSSAIIMMTLLWAFISSLLLTTKAYKFDDFLFVTNRLTSNVSNVLFLLFMSLLGAITTSLASLVFRLLLFLLKDSESLVMMNMGIGDWIMGVVVAFLYILLVATIGYLIGTVFQWGIIGRILVPVVVLSTLFSRQGEDSLVVLIGSIYVEEPVFLLYFVKVFLTAGLLLTLSTILTNRMEVRS
ncbi:hypothetical protein Q75_14895 [Bacillus coahuilensis p1.1.43]|uniref:Uncharacterized protein n=1 Tax=Bacillus coahuilensis p1.1.43 TaxID=1150625 RepID=A0A147K574_9BACI|nr:hypothetical protein [Bacillus coahuilensis]KUP04730.1 hypothetical protein Q75_14895 [Bacillus coahuilensis p1.1.43]